MIEELGDVLNGVLFHADLAAHTPGEDYDIDDVARHMTAKMVARHPHVFGDREAETAADVVAFWDDLKASEKPHRTSVLDGVPQGMPRAGARAEAPRQGREGRRDPRATDAAHAPATEAELGDTLIALVASARAQGLDAERALRGAIRSLQDDVRTAEG